MKKTKTPADIGFAECLQYSHLIAPDVIALKNGGFLAGFQVHGPDVESSGVYELEYLSERVSKAFGVLNDRWCVHFEFLRRPSTAYPDSRFPEAVTALIDLERRAQFNSEEAHFDSVQYLFLSYVPLKLEKSAVGRGMKRFLLGEGENTADETIEKQLARFEETLASFTDSLGLVMKWRRLGFIPQEGAFKPYVGRNELLEALNACVNGLWHPVMLPEFPYYLDCMLARECLNGARLQYNGQYVQTVSLTQYPAGTFPGIMKALQALPVDFRWSNRLLIEDNQAALRKMNSVRRSWETKILGYLALITGKMNGKVNMDAVNMRDEVDEAMAELNSGLTNWGHHTSAVILRDEDPQRLDTFAREVVKIFERAGCGAKIERLNALDAFFGSFPAEGKANARQPLVNSLNVADILPLSCDWVGEQQNPCPFYPAGSPPLLKAATVGSTPFSLNLHSGDLGHTLILGPTGAGKSTLLATIAAQFQRYGHSQIFYFDHGRSIYPLCAAMERSVFYDLGAEGRNEISLCPLADIDGEDQQAWAAEWIESLVNMTDPGAVTPARRGRIIAAVKQLASSTSQAEERTLTAFITSVQDETIRQALGYYALDQAGGALVDGDHNAVEYAPFSVFEISGLLGRERVAPAVLSYLFRQIQRRLDGSPSLLVIDEAWTALKHPQFSEQIREWLKTFRKLNCAVVLATQSVTDVVNSPIRDAVFESCPNRILLANPEARAPMMAKCYKEYLQLSEAQLRLVSQMVKKRQYYQICPDGRRLFELGLGPVALAFVGSGGAEDLKRIGKLAREQGSDWPYSWLKEKVRQDWADKWQSLKEELQEDNRS